MIMRIHCKLPSLIRLIWHNCQSLALKHLLAVFSLDTIQECELARNRCKTWKRVQARAGSPQHAYL